MRQDLSYRLSGFCLLSPADVIGLASENNPGRTLSRTLSAELFCFKEGIQPFGIPETSISDLWVVSSWTGKSNFTLKFTVLLYNSFGPVWNDEQCVDPPFLDLGGYQLITLIGGSLGAFFHRKPQRQKRAIPCSIRVELIRPRQYESFGRQSPGFVFCLK